MITHTIVFIVLSVLGIIASVSENSLAGVGISGFALGVQMMALIREVFDGD